MVGGISPRILENHIPILNEYFTNSSCLCAVKLILSPAQCAPIVIQLCLRSRIGLWEKYY